MGAFGRPRCEAIAAGAESAHRLLHVGEAAMVEGMSHFSDPAAVASYAENAFRKVPGLVDAHRMTSQLLAERVPSDGRVLVVGAGGGLELQRLATDHADWQFDGVDPSAEMLALATQTIEAAAERTTLIEGYVTDAPPGPYDGATCLLTLHFLPAAERLATLREIHARLRPGAPFVALHHSVPADPEARRAWFRRSIAFATWPAIDDDAADRSAAAMVDKLPALSPEQDESLLREAGFSDVALFYTALSFRGWVAYR